MFRDSNFFSFLRGGTKHKELKETKRAWHTAEREWRRSKLSHLDARTFAEEITKRITAERPLAPALREAIYLSTEALFEREAIGEIEPDWKAIERRVDLAVGLREALASRTAWATKTDEYLRAFMLVMLHAWDAVLQSLPSACFDDSAGELEVPLIELLANPAAAVEALARIPYQEGVFEYNIALGMRKRMSENFRAASGFGPKDDVPNERLILPTRSKLSGTALVDAYLSGTPFASFFNTPVPFGVPEHIRFEHCHIIGGTGHGKTQLLQKLIHQDLIAGNRSVIVVDSQGDLIQKLLRLDIVDPAHPQSIADRLVVVDPSDIEHPFALNLFAPKKGLASFGAADRERVLNGVIELYELFFSTFLGAELTARQGVIFKYLARLMLEIPDATLFTLIEIMQEGKAFKGYMDRLEGAARYFFQHEFFDPSFTQTKKQIVKRLWAVLATPAFERMFLQRKGFDLFEAMQSGKIILVHTAKDVLKREGSALLGRFFIAMVAQAALERSLVKEEKRVPTFLYVDEAHEYFDDSIETILTQARKYKVGITLAHQSLDQLDTRLRSAIFANTSTKCVGGVSVKDANILADELRTDSAFLTSMKRRGNTTQFALWVKHLTDHAIAMDVPLGYLERLPTVSENVLDSVINMNQLTYGGLPTDAIQLTLARPQEQAAPKSAATAQTEKSPAPTAVPVAPTPSPAITPVSIPRDTPHQPGKGGQKHRYLQSLIKELAETYGMKATIEAPLPNNAGQVDVLVEKDGVLAAFQVSVTTPVAYEVQSIVKCLAHYPRVVLVTSKQKMMQSLRTNTLNVLPEADHERVSFLLPEELPDFIAALAPTPEPEERVVKGYKVRSNTTKLSADETKRRREVVAALIARSMKS